MITQAVRRNTLILSLFAIATAGALALTNKGTEPIIECNRQQALRASLREVMSADHHDNVLRDDYIKVSDQLLGGRNKRIYRARQDGEPAGVVMEVTAPDGYGGPIDLLVGVDAAGTITGVRVVPPHNETPGLGDRIETRKSDWIYSFDGKSLDNPEPAGWAVKKEGAAFDAFTGATITPRAVVNAVERALRYHERHRDALYGKPTMAGGGEDPCNE